MPRPEPVAEVVELIDAIAAAVDIDRPEEVERVRWALDFWGLGDAFSDEVRLSGVPSRCDGECWSEVAA